MFRKSLILLTVSLLMLVAAVMPAAAQATWTAEYFNNANLAGAPVVTAIEGQPYINWGYGSPYPAVPADYFSARWTSVQNVAGGSYQINVRADDGVRVWVDGVPYIDRWHLATAQTYSAALNLSPGQHTFVIEFFEAAEVAFVQYEFIQTGGIPPAGATATVVTGNLNVRNIPNPYTGAILTRISYGQVYSIVGRNADTSWLQLNVNGTIGWVNASYVSATNLGGVPVTDPGTRPPPPGTTATVTAYFLNVRHIPDPYYGAILTRIGRGQTYSVIGRNAAGTWLQLNINGLIGWVNARYVIAYNVYSVPVTY